MLSQSLKLLSRIGLLIFLYYLIYAIYSGVINPIPGPGDSWDYHIPIEKMILNGSFINPNNFTTKQYYAQLFPGASEAINSIFILFNIPLTLSNVFAIIVLFFCCWKLGLTFKLKYYYALLFSLTICTLTVIYRWFNAVSIDVWVAIFFSLTVILLEKPKKTFSHVFLLGITSGMLIGSKYTGCIFIIILFLVYWRTIINYLNLKSVIIFLIPFSFLGLSWYIRNYLAVGYPFWGYCPFPVICKTVFVNNVLSVSLKYPLLMLNAFFSEYKLWMFTPFLFLIYLYKHFKKIPLKDNLNRIVLIGFLNFLIYFSFTCSTLPSNMVSSLRYSYPAFIPLILGAFIFAENYKKEELLGFIAIANMICMLSLAYYPKIIIFYLPIYFISVYFIDRIYLKFRGNRQ